MSVPLRVTDAADLLKLLTQTTADSTPDNPAEQLADYVPAPTGGNEVMAVADSVALPNTPHSPTYVYGEAVALYAKAQYR